MKKPVPDAAANKRHGVSVAAAALSFALVAPFAQPVAAPQFAAAAYAGTPDEAGQADSSGFGVKYPGENAQGAYQSVVNEQAYTFTDQPIKVEGAIESDAPEGTNESINGYVIHQRDGDLSVYPGIRDPWKPIPMAGVRVYAQWTEKGGIVSPVYTGVTREDGYYTIEMKAFTNAKGQVVKFDADPNGPQYEKIRVWVDNPDPDNFTQLYGYNFGHMGPNGNTVDTAGGMSWFVGSDRVMNARFAFGEKTRHDIMHLDKADKNPVVGNGPGQIKGNLFWHLYHTAGAFTPSLMNKMNGADVPATGMKVYGSYLSDYAVNEIKTKAAIDLGFDEIRGSGWTNRNETALQNWIKRKMAEEGKEKWIAETAEATVGSDGDYTLQFRGSFGRGRTNGDVDRGYDDGALVYTDLARDDGTEVTFPDGSKHNAYGLFGQVAPAADYGSWYKSASGRGGSNLPKHVNWDWLFFSTEETEGLGQFTPFYNNSFLPRSQYVFNGEGKWSGGMVYGPGDAYLLENRHVIYSDYIVFDVLGYDTRDNPAKPGAVVETKTSDLPTRWVDGLQYQIEWVDQETGKVVKTCDPVDPQPNGTIPSCQVDTGDQSLFPEGIQTTTTISAYLYAVNKDTGARGQAIAADAFTVLIAWQPLYEATTADQAGVTVKSMAPTFDNADTESVEKLTAEELRAHDPIREPMKFALTETFEAPEGYNISVDEATGEVSVAFPLDAPTNTDIEVPVQVTYRDGTTATGTAYFRLDKQQDDEVTVPEEQLSQQDEYEPTYAVTWGRAGQNATSVKPLFTRTLSGHSFERQPAPEGVMFALGEDAPASASIGSDGRVTVLLPDDKAKIDPIPVVVTYADQTTDTAYAEFKFRQRPQSETVDVEYQQGVMAAPGETVDVNNLAQGEMPEGAEFTLAPNQDFKGWFITVDEETGVVSATAPEDGGADTLKIKVKVTYADGSEDEVEVGVRKKPDPATSQFQPKYEDAVVTKQTAHEAPQLKGLPEGTTFSVANDGGLDVDINKRTGKLDVKARPNSTPDATHQVTVRVQYPDGTSELVTVAFTVDSQARTNTTTWETMRVPVKGIADEANKNPAPQNTKFAIAKDFAKPGWAVEVNPTTGKLTVAADKTVNVGETVEIPVVMTLPDASQRIVLVKAVAAAEQSTCDATSSVGLSSDACVEGSSTSIFGIISIILGVLALVGGGAAALFINQDTVRDILRQNGINI